MAFMEWSDKFATGIELIDTQHRWLVNLANRLHDALNTAAPNRKEQGEILEGLMDYTMNHFIAEEELFQRFGYPDTVEHRDEHNRFTARVLDLLQRHEAGETVEPEILDFLKGWLVGHILGSDQAYTPFLKSKGVA